MILRFTALTICLIAVCYISPAQTKPSIEENWRIFQPENEEFGVVTPVEMTTSGSREPKSSRRFSGSINGVYLFVFSDPNSERHNFSKISGYLKNWGQTLEMSNEPTVPNSLSFRDQHGYWQNLVVIRTETRVYIAQTISRSELDPIASRFIGSFGIGTIDVSKLVPTGQDSKMTESENSKAATNDVKVGPPDIKVKNYTLTPIKLLTKPAPTYTEMARFYGITGTIILRVIFLASGEVGTVALVETLPLGLTERAIEAAKLIRFEPSTLDGTPITVTKQLEFGFRIY